MVSLVKRVKFVSLLKCIMNAEILNFPYRNDSEKKSIDAQSHLAFLRPFSPRMGALFELNMRYRKFFYGKLPDWLGYNKRSAKGDRWTSGLGAFFSVLLVFVASGWAIGEQNLVVVTSMGSSAVLLFSAPDSPLSQPWPLVGGHFIAATVGVGCTIFLGTDILSAGMAVGIAVLLMQWTRSIHPPAGATALAAVIGGDAVTSLGWMFVLKPVLLNVILLLVSFYHIFLQNH